MTDEDEMAKLLLTTGFKPNKMYMTPEACRALGGDPEPLMNEDGVVEINPPPEK